MKASVNSQVDFQFEIGNDWGATEAVSLDNSNLTNSRAALYPFSVWLFSGGTPDTCTFRREGSRKRYFGYRYLGHLSSEVQQR
jgi:hypothetical protein